MKKSINYTITGLILAALIIAGYFYYLHQIKYPSTDDAYIQAHVIDIAPQINGSVDKIFITNQQSIKKDQLLFTIDSKPFEIALQKAQANLENITQSVDANTKAILSSQATVKQREAELVNAKKNYQRIMPLVKKGFYAKSAGDNAEQNLSVAEQELAAAKSQLQEVIAKLGKTGDDNASIKEAKASVEQARLNLSYTKIYSPGDGYIAKFDTQPGQTVTAYQALFSLVEDKHWWATANMKETSLERIHPGQKAVIHVDMYPNHVFHGTVKSISPGSGSSFALLPPENASGNWVKVVQRFPVKIDINNTDANFPLRIGASCTVSIDTTSHE